MKLLESERKLAYICFPEFIKDWWHRLNYFLKETNSKENDPLGKTPEKGRKTTVAKRLDQRISELNKLNIKHKQSAITDMKPLTEPHNTVLIFYPGRSTTLTAAKIHQMLSATKHIILNLQQLIRYKTEVMFAWRSRFDVLVLESQMSAENFQDVADEISTIPNECVVENKFIFISSIECKIQQTSALRSTFSTKLTEEYDDWKFTDLVTESMTFLLEKKVTFQEIETQIKNVVKESDFRMLNALNCD
jgi:hypothetical protein